MRVVTEREATPARWWLGSLGEGRVEREDVNAYLEVESDASDPGRVAVHTMIDGTGSHSSYYLDREAALELAAAILQTVLGKSR